MGGWVIYIENILFIYLFLTTGEQGKKEEVKNKRTCKAETLYCKSQLVRYDGMISVSMAT